MADQAGNSKVASIVLLVMSVLLSNVMGMFVALQEITMLPLIKSKVPANAEGVFA